MVLLVVILIPLLLDDAREAETRITTTNIPEQPDEEFTTRLIPVPEPEQVVPAEVMVAPAQPPLETDSGRAGEMAAEAEAPPDTEVVAEVETASEAEVIAGAEVAPAVETAGLTGWVVQVGSFSRKNADSLNNRLRAAGYSSYVVTEPVKTRDGSLLYRVRIGPEVLRSEALKLKAEIKKELDMDGLVLNYP